jgi:hypothetical protein
MEIEEFVCYYNSLHYINHTKELKVKYHIHVVMIQDIKEPLSQNNRKLREQNQ